MTIEGVGIIAFCALMIGIGILVSKQAQKSTENYFLSGRNNSLWLITAGHVMGWVGSGTLVGVYGTAYGNGVSAAIWYPIGFTVAFLFFGKFFALRYRRLGAARHCMTLPDMLNGRFGRKSSSVFAFVLGIQEFGNFAGQIIAIAAIMNLSMGVSYIPACIFASVIILVYSLFGGLTGTLTNTLIQMCITLVGLVLAIIVGIQSNGGYAEMMSNIPTDWETNIFAGQTVPAIIASFMPTFMTSFVYNACIMRILSAKDDKTAVNSYYAAFVVAAIIVAMTVVGCYVVVTCVPGLERGDYALIALFRQILPMGAALFAAAILSACMSTASEAMLSPTAMFVSNIYKGVFRRNASDRQMMVVTRAFMVVFCGISTLIAVNAGALLDLVYFTATLCSACAIPTTVGFFWNRATTAGYMSGCLGGAGAAILTAIIPALGIEPFWACLITSIVLFFAVSLMTPKSPETQIRFARPFQTANWREEEKSTLK